LAYFPDKPADESGVAESSSAALALDEQRIAEHVKMMAKLGVDLIR
jgi:hypothetical protein